VAQFSAGISAHVAQFSDGINSHGTGIKFGTVGNREGINFGPPDHSHDTCGRPRPRAALGQWCPTCPKAASSWIIVDGTYNIEQSSTIGAYALEGALSANEGQGSNCAVGGRWLVLSADERQSPPVSPSNQPGTVTVSGKASIEVPIGTLNSALRQAGLKK
jgi:hypothetical protein